MSDVISRQVAISAICSACGKIDCDKMDKCEKLQLPPTNCSEFPNSSDTISRQQAIEAVNSLTYPSSLMDVKRKLIELPPAQPRREERKIGEWIYDWGDWDFETCKCSECGNHTTTPIGERYSFCPNCGADMRGEDNETN